MSKNYCLIQLEEGRRESLDKLVGDYCDKRLIKEAINELKAILVGPSRKFECLEPRIEEINGKCVIKPGFWTGIAEVYLREKPVIIYIKPRLNKYEKMLEKINKVLGSRYLDMLPPGTTIPYLYPSTPIPNLIRNLLAYIEWLIENEPRRICFEQAISGENMARFNITKSALITNFKKLICKPNTGLALTLTYSFKAISDTLNAIERILNEYEENYNIHFPKIRKSIEILIESLRINTRNIYYRVSDFIESTVLKPNFEEEIIKYTDVLYNIKKLSEQELRISHGGKEYARLIMFPSTKVYELYVLSTLIEKFKKDMNCLSDYRFGEKEIEISLYCDNRRFHIYFNRVPEKYSSIIKKLACRTPRPDILIITNNKAIIVEAKYRFLRSKCENKQSGILRLDDAIRLTSYLIDIATGYTRKAIVVALNRPNKKQEKIDQNHIKINIFFSKMNPDNEKDNDINEIIEHILS